MKNYLFKFYLLLLSTLISTNIYANKRVLPTAYQGLNEQSYQLFSVPTLNKSSKNLSLLLNNNLNISFNITHNYTHNNGDISILANNPEGSINATIGTNSIFGQIHFNNKHYILTTEGPSSWIIQLPENGIHFNNCDHEGHVTKKVDLQSIQKTEKGSPTIIDLLIVYNQTLRDRYPGQLLQTRFNHYLNIANQVTANTGISLAFRLVANEQLPYDHMNSNQIALNDMRTSLDGGFVEGMQNLKQLRESVGADLIIFIRPYDLEIRGNCGQAFFPRTKDGVNFDPSFGLHMISDGMDSWSLCSDQVMIHELGHNLGAGHHNVPEEYLFIEDAAGYAKSGRFATVMGSFGTGQPERFMRVDMFSNPDLPCAGAACGVFGEFNNATVINLMKDVVANYQPSISSIAINEYSRVNPDHDNDGVNDWDDSFPFDPLENSDTDNDGQGDASDAFINNPFEQIDTDEDGIGNNQDLDDDNDGINDTFDSFPLDASESQDSDGDGIGDISDEFPNISSEQLDFDQDGIGDNQDIDDDNDSFTDIDNVLQDLLIINTGNNRIMRFDAQTGDSHGTEVLSTDGLLTFHSDLSYREESQTLFYTSSSGVKSLDLMSRETKGIYVPAFSDNNNVQLQSGFPTSLSSINGENLVVSRISNPQILILKGQKKASVDLDIAWNIANGDNSIDIITLNNDSFILGQEGYLYSTQNSNSIDAMRVNGLVIQRWMDDPYALASNGSTLFTSNQGPNKIVAVDLNSSQLFENFIQLDELAYSNPTGMAVTNENILLVAASDQNAILKFNASTGEFLGELVSGSGLDNPHKMILVPRLNDRFHHDIDKVIKPNAGLWFNPDTNGRGFDIEIFNNRLVVIWYTYDEEGLPTWYISSGEFEGFTYTGNFDKTHLNPDGTFTSKNVGSISIVFDNERTAQVDWQIDEVQDSESIQWIVWSNKEEVNNYTGLWGRSDGPGWGVSVATIGSTSIAIPYIYDQAGEPRWLISDPVNTSSPLNFTLNAVFSDTLCPSCSGEPLTTRAAAGNMTLNLNDSKSWQSQVQFPQPIVGEWILENTDIILFSSDASRPR